MIFSRKYVFETKKTRTQRLLLNGLVSGVILSAAFTIFLLYIPFVAKLERQRAQEAFYQKSPDAIVVFTGDKGRIAKAIELIKRNPTAKLFISGVYGSNSLKTLLVYQSSPEDQLKAQEMLTSPEYQVDLDYEARNTMENVKETLELLQNVEEKIEKVLVISSDYHIFRIRMIFETLLTTSKKPVTIYYDSISHPTFELDSLKKLLMESLKIFRAYFILKFE